MNATLFSSRPIRAASMLSVLSLSVLSLSGPCCLVRAALIGRSARRAGRGGAERVGELVVLDLVVEPALQAGGLALGERQRRGQAAQRLALERVQAVEHLSWGRVVTEVARSGGSLEEHSGGPHHRGAGAEVAAGEQAWLER